MAPPLPACFPTVWGCGRDFSIGLVVLRGSAAELRNETERLEAAYFGSPESKAAAPAAPIEENRGAASGDDDDTNTRVG